MAEYIEREAITEYLMGRIKDYLEMGDRLAIIPLNFAMAHIKSLPTADVEPVRHGDWDVILDDWEDTVTLKCPLCREEFRVLCEDDEIPQAKYNYCPNCGAKMEGGANDA